MSNEVFPSHARLCDISTALLERDLWCRTEVAAAVQTCRRLICVVQVMKEDMVMHIMVIYISKQKYNEQNNNKQYMEKLY